MCPATATAVDPRSRAFHGQVEAVMSDEEGDEDHHKLDAFHAQQSAYHEGVTCVRVMGRTVPTTCGRDITRITRFPEIAS